MEMNKSDILYMFYSNWIENASAEVLMHIRLDVIDAKKRGALNLKHYAKLIREIAKRKKDIKIPQSV